MAPECMVQEVGSWGLSVGVWVESCNIVFPRRHFLFTCSDTCHYHVYCVPDGRTDRRTTVSCQ